VGQKNNPATLSVSLFVLVTYAYWTIFSQVEDVSGFRFHNEWYQYCSREVSSQGLTTPLENTRWQGCYGGIDHCQHSITNPLHLQRQKQGTRADYYSYLIELSLISSETTSSYPQHLVHVLNRTEMTWAPAFQTVSYENRYKRRFSNLDWSR